MNLQRLKSASELILRRTFQAQSIHFYRLLGVATLLTVVGLIMVLSASTINSIVSRGDAFAIFNRQFGSAVLGFLLMMGISLMPPHWLRRGAPFLAAGVLLAQMLVLTTTLGVTVNGNRNWLEIPGVGSIQPSEFMKIALIVALASFIVSRDIESNPPRPFVMASLGVALLALAPIVVGKDIGSIIIFVGFLLGMYITLDLEKFVYRRIYAALALGALVIWRMDPTNNRFTRFGNWVSWIFGGELDPEANWQFLHGTWALAEGGLFGVGFGKSRLKWNWVPAAENDFIFAIIAEEGGLVGALTLIAIILLLGLFMRKIWIRTTDPFAQLTSAGIVFWIMLQSFVNLSVVLGNLPVLGVPLPFVSAGGSSLIASMMAIGVLLAFERENHALEGSPELHFADFFPKLRVRR